MSLSITIADFKNLGIVAQHCDNEKLNIAIEEALDFDLCTTFKDLGVQIKIMINEVLSHALPSHGGFVHQEGATAYWDKVVKGNVYTKDEKPKENLGLKRGVVYYAYSRYLVLSSFSDSASGFVSKNNDFSIPKPLKEVEQQANKYRNMGKACFLSAMEYICLEIDNIPELKDLDCESFGCGCSTKSACGIKTKGYGLKGQIIRKHE